MHDLTDTRHISRLEIVDTGRRRSSTVGRRQAADSRGEFFGSAAGIGDGASAWDFQPAAVRLAQDVSRSPAATLPFVPVVVKADRFSDPGIVVRGCQTVTAPIQS